MRAHGDEIRVQVRFCPQDGVERIAGCEDRTASHAAELGYRTNPFGQDAFGLAPLDLDRGLRLIVIDHMHESEFCSGDLGQEAGAMQGAAEIASKNPWASEFA